MKKNEDVGFRLLFVCGEMQGQHMRCAALLRHISLNVVNNNSNRRTVVVVVVVCTGTYVRYTAARRRCGTYTTGRPGGVSGYPRAWYRPVS